MLSFSRLRFSATRGTGNIGPEDLDNTLDMRRARGCRWRFREFVVVVRWKNQEDEGM
jgi:hypothetical protein